MADNLIPIDIKSFRNATRDIDFDVFLKVSDQNMAHVFSRSTGLDYKRLAQYIEKGVKELFIREEDKPRFEAFILKTADSIFNDPNAAQDRKIAALLNMTEQSMAELFNRVEVHPETAASAQKLVRNYVDVMSRSPETLAMILKLVSHGDYLYYHSIAVAIFSMFIARASGQFNQRMMELVGMGGFLHDIGCTQLPKEIVCSPTELSTTQWVQMHEHPRIGLKMLEKTKNLPDEVRYIVYQHHEEPSGHGYPNCVHGGVIYYPAKIVALADSFSALISNRPFRPAYSVEQAIEIIQQGAGSKYDRDLVKILTGVFLKKPVKSSAA